MAIRLHCPDLDLNVSAGASFALPEGPARHLGLVLRAKVGSEAQLFDGRGQEVRVVLEEVTRKGVSVQVIEAVPNDREAPLAVHLGQAISKGDRMDYAIQKACEMGVAAITPLYTARGDVKLKGERADKKLAHWQGVAASACEQCGRSVVPVVHAPVAMTQWLAERDEPLRLILQPGGAEALNVAEAEGGVTRASLLIGPEGGFTQEEVAEAAAAGCEVLGLGPRILRTETAPVVALTLLQQRFGDLPR
ncbi:16S rRNA (uracil(1498)-N(3))-methyltransferase [Cobetia sp. cqz5-12]|uniref:16S rRNA (uracil(1498)-N(3))-methyltransferase n=1 Tax=Cobetia sp. cqz5-12 TaxID=2609415 RepID=UPI0019054C1B|nr:16S rRNA (uracil(1498)-N(3))-methyltransferase [Cobetia sp. cqz5-12]QQK62751.1 16S rRNA (uracil(1498)-N(3))-methyltransferase [Cobetia sp. cqz5-12]